MTVRKAFLMISSPFRTIKKIIYDWINSSNHMSADWIRRHRLEQFKAKNGCNK